MLPHILISTIVIFLAILLGIGSKYIFQKDDNFIEKIAEKIIEENLGNETETPTQDAELLMDSGSEYIFSEEEKKEF